MVAIIGGGPVGLMTSIELSRRGISNTVFEEHKKIGKPVQCTGIVTKEFLKYLKVIKDSKCILNRLKKVRIHKLTTGHELNVCVEIARRLSLTSLKRPGISVGLFLGVLRKHS